LNAGQRNLQVALDVVAQCLERRNVNDVGGVIEVSVDTEPYQIINAARKAASVLPEPVGAAIKVFRCSLIAGQACSCGGVGAGKLSANQRATADEMIRNSWEGIITQLCRNCTQ